MEKRESYAWQKSAGKQKTQNHKLHPTELLQETPQDEHKVL